MDELEINLKAAVVAWPRYFSGIFLEGLRKTTKSTAMKSSVPTEIRNDDLPNMRL
jgi:hypothetical protein